MNRSSVSDLSAPKLPLHLYTAELGGSGKSRGRSVEGPPLHRQASAQRLRDAKGLMDLGICAEQVK